MRGVKSEAMVFCATAPDGSKVELLSPVDTSKVKPGDRIYFEGLEGKFILYFACLWLRMLKTIHF